MRTRSVIVNGRKRVVAGAVGIVSGVAVLASMVVGPGASLAGDGANTQVARLYQLQAAFHEALSAPAPGEDNDLTQRVQDLLALFDDEAVLHAPNNITYTGAGKEDCSPGTICDFFTNFSPALNNENNRWVSLSPAYKTEFDIRGNTASVYFECIFFDDKLNPPLAGGTTPLRINADGTAKKVRGQWVFTELTATVLQGAPHP